HLAKRLPEDMQPSGYVEIAEVPLTSNGKVEREALSKKGEVSREREEEYRGPRGVVEEMVAEIWKEVLKVERVGREEGFFDSGGHSLLATQIVSRVREAFGVEMGLREFFARPTVAGQAEMIERGRGKRGVAPEVARRERRGSEPLSYAQERL